MEAKDVESTGLIAAKGLEWESDKQAQLSSTVGLRYNTGKVKLSMVHPSLTEGAARALMYGELKYERDNWQKGMLQTEVMDSLLRHASEWMKGEDIDEESGCHHFDHMAANLMMIMYDKDVQNNRNDDRVLDYVPKRRSDDKECAS